MTKRNGVTFQRGGAIVGIDVDKIVAWEYYKDDDGEVVLSVLFDGTEDSRIVASGAQATALYKVLRSLFPIHIGIEEGEA